MSTVYCNTLIRKDEGGDYSAMQSKPLYRSVIGLLSKSSKSPGNCLSPAAVMT